MNSQQRIMTALARGTADRVPIFEFFDPPILDQLADRLGIDTPDGPNRGQEQYCRVAEALGIDGVVSVYAVGLEELESDKAIDRYGCVYTTGAHFDNWLEDGPIKTMADLEVYDMASKIQSDDFDQVRFTEQRAGESLAHFLVITDPFRISWMLRGGMEHLLMDYLLAPDLVHGLARIATDFNLAIIDHAAECGVDLLLMDGDLADERTTIMSPDHFRTYIKPPLLEIIAHAHSKGMKIVKHTDGSAWPIMEDLVEAGFDGFHPIQPQCMEIEELKTKHGNQLCLMGNIDCRHLLPYGTPDEVRAAVRETIEIAAPGGGYIITSSNSVHKDCNVDNYLAMVEAAKEYGGY